MSAFLPFTVANLRFNSVVDTKLPAVLSHRRSATVSLETYSFTIGNTNFDLKKKQDFKKLLLNIRRILTMYNQLQSLNYSPFLAETVQLYDHQCGWPHPFLLTLPLCWPIEKTKLLYLQFTMNMQKNLKQERYLA